jgi:hypothetical protein
VHTKRRGCANIRRKTSTATAIGAGYAPNNGFVLAHVLLAVQAGFSA